MNTFMPLLAQASQPAAESGDGSAVAGFIVMALIFFVVCGIYNAATKKKEYDVRLGGTIKQR